MKNLTMCRRFIMNLCAKTFRNKLQFMIVSIGVIILICFYRHKEIYTGSKFKVYIMMFGDKKLHAPTQRDIDTFSKNIRIKYTVEDNLITGDNFGTPGYFAASLSLLNTGSEAIPAKRWELYGYFFRLIEPKSYPYQNGFYIDSCGLKVYHITGTLYKFTPSGDYYAPILPGEFKTCILKVAGFQVARTDSMPNWYVTGSNLVPKIILNTQGESLRYVSDFISPRQYKRRKDDPYSPMTSSQRYDLYNTVIEKNIEAHPVVPQPLEIQVSKDKTIEWNAGNWRIVNNQFFSEEIKYLADKTGMKIVMTAPVRKMVKFQKASVLVEINGKEIKHPEAYILHSEPGKDIITITASATTGAFYAIQTLLSLVFTPFMPEGKGGVINVPAFSVKDVPRYTYRGLHIDVARNFHSKEEIKKLIVAMATYKLNKLHLHLSDDEGWRLEIPGIPELTHIGSRRCHDTNEEQCIMPALGSGPYDNSSGTGYFSVWDYKSILQFAKSHHIEVIPEIDMPGHSRAAIRSVHAKSQQSHRSKMEGAPVYHIIDENDTADYRSGQSFHANVINPCMESTYVFVRKLLSEIKKMHADIQPLKVFHFGGDEVAQGAWTGSKTCQEFRTKNPDLSTQHDLMRYFIRNVARIAMEEDISIGAWEDGLLEEVPYSRTDFKNKSRYNMNYDQVREIFKMTHMYLIRPSMDTCHFIGEIYAFVWKRMVEERTPHRSILLANNDYKVVLSYGSFLYFDHPYEADPEERGLYWATRKINTYDVWGFNQNMIHEDDHLPCPSSVKEKSDCFQLKKPENIVGIQAQIWTETVRTGEQMDYMLFPRLLAVAERAWHQASWEDDSDPAHSAEKNIDWLKFRAAVGGRELRRLDAMGIQYRVPPPGAKVKDGKLLINTAYPGEDVEVFNSIDQTWSVASFNIPVTHALNLRTRSADSNRYSRVITVYPSDTGASSSSSHGAKQCLIFILFINICTIAYMYMSSH